MLRSARVSDVTSQLHGGPPRPLTCAGLVQRWRSLGLAEMLATVGSYCWLFSSYALCRSRLVAGLFVGSVLAFSVGLGLWGVAAHGCIGWQLILCSLCSPCSLDARWSKLVWPAVAF
eukprot:Gb_04257 [translate_table: standard]